MAAAPGALAAEASAIDTGGFRQPEMGRFKFTYCRGSRAQPHPRPSSCKNGRDRPRTGAFCAGNGAESLGHFLAWAILARATMAPGHSDLGHVRLGHWAAGPFGPSWMHRALRAAKE